MHLLRLGDLPGPVGENLSVWLLALGWPEACRNLRDARSEAEWDALLAQTATVPQAKGHKMALGASQMIRVLEASRQAAGMSPRVAVALGTWVITAILIAHSGPLDADLSLEDLADCL